MNIPEYHALVLRDLPLTMDQRVCESPDHAYHFWKANIRQSPRWTPGVENFYVIHLNTRRRATGFQIISTGTLDTLLVHSREVFRMAIVQNAAAILLGHNHPSGDPAPSEADIKVTRDLIRAGQLLKIEVLDHVIVADEPHAPDLVNPYCSLKALGYVFC